jgi:hypothetical protein
LILELSAGLGEMAGIVFAAVLHRHLKSSRRPRVCATEGGDRAGLCKLGDETIVTPVYTDRAVAELETIQHALEEGPCLDLMADGRVSEAEDVVQGAR